MKSILIPYDRKAAVRYAHRWAYGRNPDYYDYEELGGDCTNFASQCLYAGSGIMDRTRDFGWYYENANDKSPSWTGVPYFYNYLTRTSETIGPVGIETDLTHLNLGDFVQLRFGKQVYGHTPIVVAVGKPATLRNTLVAAHSYNADWRPLSTYLYDEIRYIHILGVRSEGETDSETEDKFT